GAGGGDGAGAPGRDPVPPGSDPARHDQLPRGGNRAPGRRTTGSAAVEGIGFPDAGRGAGLGLHHRDPPRGGVPDLRPGRVPVRDARPGRRSGTGVRDPRGEDMMTASGTEPRIDPPDHGALGIDEIELRARIAELLNRWPAVGLAGGVVRSGSLEFFSGHGLADIASNTPITQDTVFRIASITKTFTAIAVLPLWEQGLVALDAPANDYQRAYQLIPAKASFRPATVRQ